MYKIEKMQINDNLSLCKKKLRSQIGQGIK